MGSQSIRYDLFRRETQQQLLHIYPLPQDKHEHVLVQNLIVFARKTHFDVFLFRRSISGMMIRLRSAGHFNFNLENPLSAGVSRNDGRSMVCHTITRDDSVATDQAFVKNELYV